jgi:SRSO17 transposase
LVGEVLQNNWQEELQQWLQPYLRPLKRVEQRRCGSQYVHGLLLPEERKSVTPLGASVSDHRGASQSLNHFLNESTWPLSALKQVHYAVVNGLSGGSDALLVIDDTALVKQGDKSVGVAYQYCGELGKKANCQAIVTLTLVRHEVPVALCMQLYLPKSWTNDPERLDKARVPVSERRFRTKAEIALDLIDELLAAGVEFGAISVDAGYGIGRDLRHGLSHRSRYWAAGIRGFELVYPADVAVFESEQGQATASTAPKTAQQMIDSLGAKAFRRVSWRMGTKGVLSERFACVRCRVADGEPIANDRHLPGEELWLVCEWRANNEKKYYLCKLPRRASHRRIVRLIKGRWACEQMHEQSKQQLGMDHFEGRSWFGLHRHLLMVMISFAFLQHFRLKQREEKKRRSCSGHSSRPSPPAQSA